MRRGGNERARRAPDRRAVSPCSDRRRLAAERCCAALERERKSAAASAGFGTRSSSFPALQSCHCMKKKYIFFWAPVRLSRCLSWQRQKSRTPHSLAHSPKTATWRLNYCSNDALHCTHSCKGTAMMQRTRIRRERSARHPPPTHPRHSRPYCNRYADAKHCTLVQRYMRVSAMRGCGCTVHRTCAHCPLPSPPVCADSFHIRRGSLTLLAVLCSHRCALCVQTTPLAPEQCSILIDWVARVTVQTQQVRSRCRCRTTHPTAASTCVCGLCLTNTALRLHFL